MPVEIWLSRRLLRSLRSLDAADHRRVEEALRQLQQSWGAPHTHGGLSIRKLTGPYYECRAGLNLRIVFRASTRGLDLVLAGSHEDVLRLLRNE